MKKFITIALVAASMSAVSAPAHASGDGTVDGQDFVVWQRGFSTSSIFGGWLSWLGIG